MENDVQNRYATYLKTTGELSTKIALGSFLLGSLLFAFYKLDTFQGYLFGCGVVYVLLATILNLLVLLNLLILFVSEPRYREYFAIKMLIVLANLPVAIFYLSTITL